MDNLVDVEIAARTSLENYEPAVLKESRATPFRCNVRPFRSSDISLLSQWIDTQEKMQLVCSDPGDFLTADIVERWIALAVEAFSVVDDTNDCLVGFFTLSRRESCRLSTHQIELCHLLVNPAYKYRWATSRIITISALISCQMGYQQMIARVVPHNKYMKAVALYLDADEINPSEFGLEDNFCWYAANLHAAIIGKYRASKNFSSPKEV